jgi:hypothetical protein
LSRHANDQQAGLFATPSQPGKQNRTKGLTLSYTLKSELIDIIALMIDFV